MDIKDLDGCIFSYLHPRYSNQKSFYKKAKVVIGKDNMIYLVSYKTIVLKYDLSGSKSVEIYPDKSSGHKKYKNNTHSSTTLRHIKEFCDQFGIDYSKYDSYVVY